MSTRIEETSIKAESLPPVDKKPENLFRSNITGLTSDELNEWLKECPDQGERYTEFGDYLTAGYEAKNCMRCDCRAVDDCKLREVATHLGLSDPDEKFDTLPIDKKINKNSNLVFERAKCIKCGLCVRSCNDLDGRTALSFVNRGLQLTISEPIGIDFYYIPSDKAEIYSNVCPTGALRKMK